MEVTMPECKKKQRKVYLYFIFTSASVVDRDPVLVAKRYTKE